MTINISQHILGLKGQRVNEIKGLSQLTRLNTL